MPRQNLISLNDKKTWDKALEGIPHAPSHRHEYCAAMAASSRLETFLYVCERDEGRVLCPVAARSFRGHKDLVSPYGNGGFVGIGELPGFAEAWSDFMGDQGFVCAYIAMNQVLRSPELFQPEQLCHRRDVFSLDLTPPLTEIERDIARAQKQKPTKWLRGGQRIVADQARLGDAFIRVYRQFAERVDAAPIYRFSEETFRALFALEGARLIGLEEDGTVTSANLFLYTDTVAEWLLGAAPAGRGRETRAVLWQAVQDFHAMGVPMLNLGGGIRTDDGVERFKSRFGTARRSLKVLQQVFDEKRFDELCRKAGAPPDGTGYFPPYHASPSLLETD